MARATNPGKKAGLPHDARRGGWGETTSPPTTIDLTKRGDLALVHRAGTAGWDVPGPAVVGTVGPDGADVAVGGIDGVRTVGVACHVVEVEAWHGGIVL